MQWSLIVSFMALLQTDKPTLGSKPCLVFTGDAFDSDAEYKRLKNCLIGETMEFFFISTLLI